MEDRRAVADGCRIKLVGALVRDGGLSVKGGGDGNVILTYYLSDNLGNIEI